MSSRIMDRAVAAYRNGNISISDFYVRLMTTDEVQEFRQAVEDIEDKLEADRRARAEAPKAPVGVHVSMTSRPEQKDPAPSTEDKALANNTGYPEAV